LGQRRSRSTCAPHFRQCGFIGTMPRVALMPTSYRRISTA
jgi:hypothetical protein